MRRQGLRSAEEVGARIHSDVGFGGERNGRIGVDSEKPVIKERWEMVDGRGAWESQKTVSPVLESVLFLMQICKSVHIYGFDHPEPYSSRGSKMQSYFDKVSDAGRYDIDSSQVLPFILRIFNIEGLVHFH
ncbi:hypothetical protein CBR_g3791 [Chara braunii]|uniref:Uncharacterized protein n=1 Tax=Chara braunii TaxID=69332 RepID=A0A388KGJ0_CHABU|nr:hypothetical protein CBR_g3791 [Chara braunii]|eukprot:GBG69093.1 hypothetical protein CBR_g3791 [Chara braunii]